MNYESLSQPWSMAAPQVTRLNISPDHPFYYVHIPKNWDFAMIEVKDKKTKKKEVPIFLPSIEMERVVPGVNGVHQIKGELGDGSSRLGKLRSKGYVILDPQDHDYMRVYPAKYGGKKHSPRWQTYQSLAGEIITNFDRLGFNLWKIELILNGDIDLPHDHFLQLQIQKEKQRPNRFIAQQHLPEIKNKIDNCYAKIEQMELARKAINADGLEYYRSILENVI